MILSRNKKGFKIEIKKAYSPKSKRKSNKTPKKMVSIRVDTRLLAEFKQVAKNNNLSEATCWEKSLKLLIDLYKKETDDKR